jgi:thiazole synthase
MSTQAAIDATAPAIPPIRIGSFTLRSRLVVGTGKYRDYPTMQAAIEASGADCVTVAVRRERLVDAQGRSILDFLPLDRLTILPNTAGCFTAEDAVRVSRLGREILEQLGNPGAGWVKLEVLGDKTTLLPDPVGTLEACKELVKDGFTVLCYSSDDPIIAARLRDAGAASVMPAGTASDIVHAMELGADGVLLNTGIAHAQNPVRMAHAMRLALDAGWHTARAGRIPRKLYANASSPWEGVITHIPGE